MSGPYHRPHKSAWFLERPGYVRFMIRELTSVGVAAYLVVLMLVLATAGDGEAALAARLDMLGEPLWKGVHTVALLAAVWHSVTWFNAVPQAMPQFVGEVKVPAALSAILMGYGPWLTLTVLIVAWATGAIEWALAMLGRLL